MISPAEGGLWTRFLKHQFQHRVPIKKTRGDAKSEQLILIIHNRLTGVNRSFWSSRHDAMCNSLSLMFTMAEFERITSVHFNERRLVLTLYDTFIALLLRLRFKIKRQFLFLFNSSKTKEHSQLFSF